MIRVRRDLLTALDEPGRDAVCAALQSAVELEHATIPPYLYALYSLVPGTNKEIASIISSVVIEEMLHLTLAANVLNALGGSPVLDRPEVIPRYPGPLPGAVEGDLVVGLAPFSIALVGDVFMQIEEPEDPLDFPVGFEAAADSVTIGEFYRRIKAAIEALGPGAFVPGPRNQIGPDRMRHSVVVTDPGSAAQAIDTIVEQGEGTRTEPLEVVGGDYAHYYRFAEVFHGRRLIRNPDAGPDAPPDERYLYAGDPVPFDPDGVQSVPANPTLDGYPPGSAAFLACRTFNYTYTSTVKVLHRALNGEPDRLRPAIGLMMSLKQQAIDMAAGTITGGVPTGPSFEYQLFNA